MALLGRAKLPVVVAAALGLASAGFVVLSPASAQAPAADPKPAPAKAATKAKVPTKGAKAAAADAAAKADPAEAQRALDAAQKAFQANKLDVALAQVNRALGISGVPPSVIAKALHLRGMIYRKQGKPAQAIADLTGALYLKGGLTDAEHADALRNRAAAYREAGLNDQAIADEKRVAGGPGAVAPAAPAPAAAPAPVASAPAESKGFFANLFSSPTAPPPTAGLSPEATPAADAPARSSGSAPIATASVPKGPAASSWTGSTKVASPTAPPPPAAPARPAPSPAATAKAAPPPPAAAAAAPTPPSGGGQSYQVASYPSRAAADALVAKLKREHAAVLAGNEPVVSEAVVGAFGTQYRVWIGPIGPENAKRSCAALRSAGLDCMPIGR